MASELTPTGAVLLPLVQQRIFTLRGQQVMIDHDLATLYGVESRRLNEQVKRNLERFPAEFRFQLTAQEYDEILRSQTVISSAHGGRRYLPYAFTEQGVAMLSAVLRSETAVQVSIQIMQTFVTMRRLLARQTVYHLGASLKDLGKKWFAFSRMEKSGLKVMERLGEVGYGE